MFTQTISTCCSAIRVLLKYYIHYSLFPLQAYFAPEIWEKTREDGKRKLKNNAVPTIFSFVKEKPKLKYKKVTLKLRKCQNNS